MSDDSRRGPTVAGGDIATDGGTVSGETSPFDTVSDVEETRQERYYHYLDIYFLTPFRIIWADWRGKFGVMVVLLYLFMGLVMPAIYDPPRILEHEPLIQPFQSLEYPLGTDLNGEDIFGLLVHATPEMFKFIIGGAVAATILATFWGTISGYIGGEIDRFMMAVADIIIAVPGLPLIIVLSALIEPRNPYAVGLLLAVNRWAGLARRLRAQVLAVRKLDYIEASTAMGISRWRIINKDVFPNLMPYIIINFVQSARGVVIASVALYFLGVLPFSAVNWGVMLNLAYGNGALRSPDMYHWFLAPLFTIVLMSLGLVLLGQSADKLFNPRLQARHAKTAVSDDEAGGPPEV